MNLLGFILLAAEASAAGAAEPLSIGAMLGWGVGLAVLIGLIPIAASWLKKNKYVQKLHAEGLIDAGAKRFVRYLEDLQKTKDISGADVMKFGIGKFAEKFGIGETDAEVALRAAYTHDKRIKDAMEKAAANADFPTPPEKDS